MKSRFSICIAVVTVCASLAGPVGLAAQNHPHAKSNTQYHHYQFIDLGTFGGPASYFSNGLDGILSGEGTAVGWADTSTPDPFPTFCFNPDCYVSHAFQGQRGTLADLGTLAGGASSQAVWISASGLIVGNAQNGQLDPLFAGFPETRAVIWRNGGITDLGTIEGGYESFVGTANSSGQVVGIAMNTVPDPYNINGPGFFPTESRAFLWQNATMQDLGTLGTGNDANASFINEAGQIAGISYTNNTPNPTTGVPTIDPFLWEKGQMTDLGTLGGTIGSASGFNNRGDVIGQSNLSGDVYFHPFLWSKKTKMKDLGTLGGNTGTVNWINDSGDIAGKADLPGQPPENHDAVLWQHRGQQMIDLGVLPGDACANAYNVNNRGQVVGTSENSTLCQIPTGEHAFLWEHGGPMVDLNSLIPPGSSLELTFAFAINDSGEIIGVGVPSGCTPENVELCGHAFALTPCDDLHPGLDGCDYSLVEASAMPPSRPAELPAASPAAPLRQMFQRKWPVRPGIGEPSPAPGPGPVARTDNPSGNQGENYLHDASLDPRSPIRPPRGFPGHCIVSHGKLDGFCITSAFGFCSTQDDPSSCPPGTRESRSGQQTCCLGGFCGHTHIDLDTSCN
jgi:probable HAF family extracellular repeat protein